MSEIEEPSADEGRRGFIKKAAYVAPLIMTLNVMPAHATYGSQKYNLKIRKWILKKKLNKIGRIKRILKAKKKFS